MLLAKALNESGLPAALNVSDDPAEDMLEISARRVGANFTISFSKQTGLPVQIEVDGVRRLQSMMLPNFWRPFNDNELGSGAHRRLSKWRHAGVPGKGHHRVLSPVTVVPSTVADGALVVQSHVEVTSDGAILNTSCHVTTDGIVIVNAHLEPPQPMTRGEIPSIESLISLRSLQGGRYIQP